MRIQRISIAILASFAFASPASAQTLNSFRAAHGRLPLHSDFALAGIARSHAVSMAARGHLDHDGFLQRAMLNDGASAENVSYGCADEACAIRQWAASGGHRANMLRTDVERYGIASATAANGRKYWVLELAGTGGGRVVYFRGGRRVKAGAAPVVAGPVGRDLGIER